MDVKLIDLSRPRVRFMGRVLDKCALSFLISDIGREYHIDTTYTDVYCFYMKYSELRERLIYLLKEVF